MLVLILILLSAAAAQIPTQEDFPHSAKSFDTSDTWTYCRRVYRNVHHKPWVRDYGALISFELRLMAALGGGAVILDEAVYNVRSPIRILSNTCLIGSSMANTVLSVSSDAPLFLQKDYRGVLHAIDVANVTIRDLTINANTPASKKGKLCNNQLTKFGVYLEAAEFLNLDHVKVLHACAYGIDFPGNDFKMSSNVALNRVVVDSAGKDGVKIVRSYNVSVLDSAMINNGRHGIHIAGSDVLLIAGSIVTAKIYKRKRNHSCGVLITDRQGLTSSRINILHQRVLDTTRAGVCIMHADYVQVSDAIIDNLPNHLAPCYEISSTSNYRIRRGMCNSSHINIVRSRCLGIKKSRACCPSLCGKCGGKGCSKRAPFGACCVKKIGRAANLCTDGPPPCNLL